MCDSLSSGLREVTCLLTEEKLQANQGRLWVS